MVNLQQFLDYFLNPTKEGYTIEKTLTYGILLVIGIYLIYEIILKKLKIKPDKRLVVAIFPYIIFGAGIRVFRDAKILTSDLFVTPNIYGFVATIVIAIIFISLYLQKKKGIPYFKSVFWLGLFLSLITIPFLKIVNPYGIFLVLVFISPWLLLFCFFKRWGLENRMTTLVQLFDATVTFVALNYFSKPMASGFFGFVEQHVVPKFIIGLFGPISFVFVKLIVVVTILILIDKLSDDKEFNTYLKICIGVLGAATGTRDFIALATLT
jgi:uncharacterized membrane protein